MEAEKIIVAVDTIILAIGEKGLEVVLIKIKNGPYGNLWAMPGAVVKVDESLDEAAKRVVTSRVGNNKLHLDQLYCFGDPKRDIRGRSISVAYFAFIRDKAELKTKLNELYTDIAWCSVDELPKLAYDHKKIIDVARRKLAYKLDEVEVVRTLLPEKFTLGELLRIHEVISGKEIDKRNFIKKIMNEGQIEVTKEMKSGGAFRPARLYRFK